MTTRRTAQTAPPVASRGQPVPLPVLAEGRQKVWHRRRNLPRWLQARRPLLAAPISASVRLVPTILLVCCSYRQYIICTRYITLSAGLHRSAPLFLPRKPRDFLLNLLPGPGIAGMGSVPDGAKTAQGCDWREGFD